ncbi:ABC transporter substrate-binding protein [Frigoribacterium sp. CG_9.8]|uniref:ABC transporter substrate-binding protein n=1 Tax=Frigoribacterium sp. CG_9.8 TaxID=2787733 RepID=UPI0018C9B7D9|nr:ABC transporter substrate-binding protein [Frigoribacterium sp. CG_9.8]MBG6108945.1 peptide/nickel transport system substrate-binding protein [Frigoribacterium sp. CG_9.8]
MNKNHRTIFISLIAISGMILTGCSAAAGSNSTATAGQPVAGGDLRIARSSDAISMDSTSASFENYSIEVYQNIGESLFTVTDDGKTVKPWLASGYTVSSDNLTYTIALRQGVKFSNGQPLTAKDVKFSIDQDTKTADTGWGFINAAIDKVTVVDDATVTVSLKYPWAPILADLSLFSNAIIPDNYGGKTAAQFFEAPVGTGPFKWDEWKKGQYLKLVKNPNYWQKGKPLLDSVTYSVVPDANTRKLQLQGGQTDIDNTPDWASFASLKSSPGVKVFAFPSTQIDYVAINQQRAPFSDIHVRRAIAFAIDRKALVKAVLFGNGSEANSLIPPGTPFYDKNAPGPSYDPAKAKAELAMSSQPNGFSTSVLIRSGDANQSSVAQIMQAELKAIGITMEIKQLDATAAKKAAITSEFDMNLSAWTMDIPDPDEWTTFATDPTSGNHSAFTFYNNPVVNDLNKKAQQETDPAKREVLYKELQKTTGNDAFLTYLYYSPYAFATSDKVGGYKVSPLLTFHLENVYKTK